MKKMSALCLVLLVAAPLAHSADTKTSSFVKLSGKAKFIRGDNLVMRALPETGTSAFRERQSPRDKAEGLSAVMVTRNGDLYESRMDPQDVAIFEKAIKDLERVGRTATTSARRRDFPRLKTPGVQRLPW